MRQFCRALLLFAFSFHAAISGNLAMATTTADQPAPGAQTLAELQAANNIAAARYGAVVVPPAGKVENFEKLLPIVLALQPAAYDKLAASIAGTVAASVEKEKKDGNALAKKSVLITTRTNTGSLILSAGQIRNDVERIRDEGKLINGGPPTPVVFGAALTIPAILSMASGIDALVGLFRTDYDVASGEAESNKLGLQLAVHRQLRLKNIDAKIDELDLAPVDTAKFNDLLTELAQLRQAVVNKTPAADSREANFVAAADKVLSALQAAGTDGVTPAAKIAALLGLEGNTDAIIYLGPIKITASAVPTKRLFHRNAKVHLILSGLVNVVHQKFDGTIVSSATLTLGEKATLDLRKLEDKSAPALDITTSESFPGS